MIGKLRHPFAISNNFFTKTSYGAIGRGNETSEDRQ